jgi:hypothetical protein
MNSFLAVFLLVTAIACAQGPNHALDPDLLVRLSYERWPGQQICISVSQDGSYHIISPSKATGPVRLKGKMVDDQLLRLKKMLAAPAFRSLSSNHAGMIRNHAENFRAEVSQVELQPAFQFEGDKSAVHPRSLPAPPRRLHWLNADDERPFPAPIAQLVDWMENFKPKNAKPFDYSEFPEDVCPSVGLSLVQPTVAANGHP